MKPPQVTPDTIFVQLFTYYNHLQLRKIQHIAALFTAAGLFFTAWKDMQKSEFADLFALAAAFTFMVLLQAFSQMRRRLYRLARQINRTAGTPILDVARQGSLGVEGITLYLYGLTIVFASTWIVICWTFNPYAAACAGALLVVQLPNLNWRYTWQGSAGAARTCARGRASCSSTKNSPDRAPSPPGQMEKRPVLGGRIVQLPDIVRPA